MLAVKDTGSEKSPYKDKVTTKCRRKVAGVLLTHQVDSLLGAASSHLPFLIQTLACFAYFRG